MQGLVLVKEGASLEEARAGIALTREIGNQGTIITIVFEILGASPDRFDDLVPGGECCGSIEDAIEYPGSVGATCLCGDDHLNLAHWTPVFLIVHEKAVAC